MIARTRQEIRHLIKNDPETAYEEFFKMQNALEKFYSQGKQKICMKWFHKETGEIIKVAPWFEIPEPVLELSGDDAMKALNFDEPRSTKFGSLVQVGWLLENANGVYLGVGLSAAEHFEVYNEND